MDKLIQNQKAGVVFSDLECTLVGGGELWTWEEYTEECKKAAEFINLIISNNNYFVIVSSSYHDAVERVARKYNIIYNLLSKENRDKIIFFCSHNQVMDEKKFDDITVSLIKEKEECVDIVLKKLKEAGIEITEILGLGDDEKDLNMLLKIKELGGNVGIIADSTMRFCNLLQYLDFEKRTLDENIDKIIEYEFSIESNKLINKTIEEAQRKRINFIEHFTGSEEYVDLIDRKTARKSELKEGYLSGNITAEALQNCLTAAELTVRYYNRYVREKELSGEQIDVGIDKKIYALTENISSSAISTNTNMLKSSLVRKLLK